MKIKDGMKQEYTNWKHNNADGRIDDYGGCVFYFAEHWANAMENGIEHGRRLEDTAEECEEEIRSTMGEYGLTGFQYGAAVATLAKYWEYGEQLRQWHNLKTQISNEGERANQYRGVLNPALMSFQPKE